MAAAPVSLAALMDEATTVYTGLPIELRAGGTATLLNPVMLADAARDRAVEQIAALDQTDGMTPAEQFAAVRDALTAVADDQALVRAEIADWPVPALLLVLQHYMKAVQLGEA
ncbi:phage tail assembly protein [Kitasatospora sp. NPDC092948]|uniref:phage tail assembly protein n=1 Tax=Kitasatospora sp. NPDC092948 TaxID=3364088 RepID=UPI00381B68DC